MAHRNHYVMTSPLKVLMLEDQLPKAEHLQQLLRNKRPNWQLSLVANRETFLQALEQFKPDVIVADHTMESFSALEALELSKNRKEQTAFIMITDALSEDVHELINHGANDFVLRDTPARLPAAIESALRHSNAEKERLAAIEKLNLNEENYRKLVQRISDGFMAVDVNWRFTYLNKKAEELFGKSADYLVGKNLWAEYPQQIYRNFYRAFHRAMTTQEIGHIADFSTLFNRWIEATIYPSLSGLSIFFRDISEERKKEEKIKESEEKYRTLFELALDGIFLADYNGNILDVNSSLCAIFGQPRDKIVGTNLFAGFLRDEAARLEEHLPGEEVPREPQLPELLVVVRAEVLHEPVPLGVLHAPEVDDAVALLVAATDPAHRDVTIVVAPTGLVTTLRERLDRLAARQLRIVRHHRMPESRSDRAEFLQTHRSSLVRSARRGRSSDRPRASRSPSSSRCACRPSGPAA